MYKYRPWPGPVSQSILTAAASTRRRFLYDAARPLLLLYAPPSTMSDLEKAKQFFDKCDADHSGKIRKCEVYNVLRQFKTHEEAIEFMAVVFKFDKDADGEISWEEFKTAIEHTG